MRDRTKVVLTAIGVVFLAVIITVVGWQAHWWLKQATVNHNNKITRSSYEYQTAQATHLESDLNNITSLDSQIQEQPQNAIPLTAQKKGFEHDYCFVYGTIQGSGELTVAMKIFYAQACNVPQP